MILWIQLFIIAGFGAGGSVGLGVKVGLCVVSMTTQVSGKLLLAVVLVFSAHQYSFVLPNYGRI